MLLWIATLSLGAAPGCNGCATTPGAQTSAPAIDASAIDASAIDATIDASEPDGAPDGSAREERTTPPAFEGVRWGPRGRSLATWRGCSCPDGTPAEDPPETCAIHIWDLSTGQIATTYMTRCSKRAIWPSWSPSGKLFVISNHNTLRTYRVADGALLYETPQLPEAGVYDWSPDGRLLFWGNLYGTAQLLDPGTGAVLRAGQVLPLGMDGDWNAQWSPDGRFLTIAAENGPFFVWDGHTAAPLRELRVPGVKPLNAVHYHWLPDSERVVFASDEGLLAIGNARTGAVKLLRRPTMALKSGNQAWITLRDDGKELVVNNGDGRIELWDMVSLRSRELLAPLGSTWTSSVEFSPDFQHIALIRKDALELVPTARPADLHRISLGDSPNPYQLVGWGDDGRYYAVARGALLGWTPDGIEVFRYAMPDPEAHVRLSSGDGLAFLMGQTLDILRLRDRRSARLGVADAETWRELLGLSP